MTFQDFVFKKTRPSCQVLCLSFLLQLQQMLSLSFASALSLAPNGRCRVLLVLGPVLPCAETSEKEWFSCYKWLCHFLSRCKYRELQIKMLIMQLLLHVLPLPEHWVQTTAVLTSRIKPMCLKKETCLATHPSDVLLKISCCLSVLLYFISYTPDYYFRKQFKLVRINFWIKNEDWSNIMFSFVEVTSVVSKAEFAANINNALTIFFLTRQCAWHITDT